MESLALRSRLPSNTGPAATTHTHSRSQHAGNRNAGSNVNTEHELALPNTLLQRVLMILVVMLTRTAGYGPTFMLEDLRRERVIMRLGVQPTVLAMKGVGCYLPVHTQMPCHVRECMHKTRICVLLQFCLSTCERMISGGKLIFLHACRHAQNKHFGVTISISIHRTYMCVPFVNTTAM